VVAALRAFREERPKSLVAVLARGKATADTWATELKAAGLADVRRAERSDFHFTPGVVVSNVHQVKGLEFDGVLLIEPADFGVADRHLLHVAITRAADRLWVVATRGRGLLR
jgi:superfamily I DNA/RNA helicase